MTVKDHPRYREVRPGLYESTEESRDTCVTPEFAAALQRHSGSAVLGRLLGGIIRRQKAQNGALGTEPQ